MNVSTSGFYESFNDNKQKLTNFKNTQKKYQNCHLIEDIDYLKFICDYLKENFDFLSKLHKVCYIIVMSVRILY